jgi:hypothetical protein
LTVDFSAFKRGLHESAGDVSHGFIGERERVFLFYVAAFAGRRPTRRFALFLVRYY